MMLQISFEEIYSIWDSYLWPNRVSKIEPTSAMTIDKKIDIKNMSFTPTFFAYKIDNNVAGVNSGHYCADNSYRSRGLYVFEEYRKQGIGKKLLLATIEQARIEHASFIWSYPKKDSWKTYESVGFNLITDWEQSELDINAYCKLDLI